MNKNIDTRLWLTVLAIVAFAGTATSCSHKQAPAPNPDDSSAPQAATDVAPPPPVASDTPAPIADDAQGMASPQPSDAAAPTSIVADASPEAAPAPSPAPSHKKKHRRKPRAHAAVTQAEQTPDRHVDDAPPVQPQDAFASAVTPTPSPSPSPSVTAPAFTHVVPPPPPIQEMPVQHPMYTPPVQPQQVEAPEPPFYKKTPFLVLIALLGIGGIILVVSKRG